MHNPPRNSRAFRSAVTTLLFLGILAAGCASVPEDRQGERDEGDPFEPFNRTMHNFNDSLDRTIVRPVAVAYRDNVPRPARTGVSNFLGNLTYPVVIVNSALQGKFSQSGRGTGRFLINTTIGVAGIFDPASRMGLEKANEDFGQTLGVWGAGPGPYLVWPFTGPSTVRDTTGSGVDSYFDPTVQAIPIPERFAVYLMRGLDARVGLLEIDHILEQEYDPYIAIREAYLQRREYLIHDGETPDVDYWDEEWDDDDDDGWDW